MPRTSDSTLVPALYSLGPSAVDGTSGENVILANGTRASWKLDLICAIFVFLVNWVANHYDTLTAITAKLATIRII